MNLRQRITRIGLLVGALFLLGTGVAQAATTATPAGTSISNSVTLNFSVNGTAQTKQTTSVKFTVDDKLAISVSNQDGGYVVTNTQPGSTAASSKFIVTNDGNATQDVILSPVDMPSGTADTHGGTSNLAIASSALYADANCSTTQPALISSLSPGSSKTVYVCSTIPSGAKNGDIAVVGLLAKVGKAGSGVALGSDDSSVDKNANLSKTLNIFADPASSHPVTGDVKYDGQSSDLGAYKVQAADLTVSKTVSVITDPIVTANGSGKPHAIPGATLKYTITIDNAPVAGQPATGLDIKDALNSDLTYIANSITVQLPGQSSPVSCGDTNGTVTGTSGGTTYSVTCNYSSTSGIEVSQGSGQNFSVPAGGSVVINYETTLN